MASLSDLDHEAELKRHASQNELETRSNLLKLQANLAKVLESIEQVKAERDRSFFDGP